MKASRKRLHANAPARLLPRAVLGLALCALCLACANGGEESASLPGEDAINSDVGGGYGGVVYHLPGTVGDMVIQFEGFDILDETQVEILVNDRVVGNVPPTPSQRWGGIEFVVVNDAYVLDSASNTVRFRSTYGEDGSTWRIRRVKSTALSGADGTGWDSPFGIDYVFPAAPDPEFTQAYEEVVGAGWVNFAQVMWGLIEPFPPPSGRHFYIWTNLDKSVTEWQKYGVHIMMTLRFWSAWATAERNLDDLIYLREMLGGLFAWRPLQWADYVPKEENWQDLREFVYNLVERYDGDGVDDMPGLVMPVLHYQLGNEYYNELYWCGSVEKLEELYREASGAARSANDQVKIILSGIGFKEMYGFYDEDPDPLTQEYLEPRSRLSSNMQGFLDYSDEFSRRTIQFGDFYDIVDARVTSYGYVSKTRDLLKLYGNPNKEIWSAEQYSNLPLEDEILLPNCSVQPYPAPSKSSLYRRVLQDPQDPQFSVINSWYRGMQAAQVVKQTMVGLHAGAEKVMMGWSYDKQEAGLLDASLAYIGLYSKTFGKMWPAGYTYGLLTEKLEGIKALRRLSMPENVYVYECVVQGGRRVYVAFYDDHVAQNHDEALGRKVVLVPVTGKGGLVKVTHIINQIDTALPEVEYVPVVTGNVRLVLSEHPVFIE